MRPAIDVLEIKRNGATFLLRVRYRQNSTWQGTLEWLEGKKRVNFRSVLEMIRLMEQVIGPTGETTQWEDMPED